MNFKTGTASITCPKIATTLSVNLLRHKPLATKPSPLNKEQSSLLSSTSSILLRKPDFINKTVEPAGPSSPKTRSRPGLPQGKS